MSVRLEAFSARWGDAIPQALMARSVVKRETWLEKEQPGTVRRYPDLFHAIHNVRRLATEHPRYNGYLVRDGGAVIGMASIITDEVAQHPAFSEPFRGTDLDYWLTTEVHRRADLHGETAEALLKMSGMLALRGAEGTDPAARQHYVMTGEPHETTQSLTAVDRVFTIVREDDTHKPHGLMTRLTLQGEAAALSVPAEYEDRFDIAKGGVPAQLYYREQTVTS